MVAPLTTTVSANASVQNAPIQNQDQDQYQDPDQYKDQNQNQNQNQYKNQDQNQEQNQYKNQDQDQNQNQYKNQNHDKISKNEMTQRLEAYLARHQNDKNNKQTPVEVVKSAANELGFDVTNDTFTLASKNHDSAVVQVMHDENDYNVNLVRSDNGQWIISSVD